MVHTTTGSLALPVPDDSDPWWLLPDTVRSLADQLELTAKPVPVGYTATWDTVGGGAVSLGSTGDSRAFYWRLGQDLVKVFVWMRFNGSGIATGSGQWRFALPFPAWGASVLGFTPGAQGVGNLWDDSANDLYPITPKVTRGDNTKVSLSTPPTSAGAALRNFTGTVPVAIAAGDEVHFQLDYKADIP